MALMIGDGLVPPGSESPEVSIGIHHYQVQGLMRLCLSALRHYTDGPRDEIIVVDNGSVTDLSPGFAASGGLRWWNAAMPRRSTWCTP